MLRFLLALVWLVPSLASAQDGVYRMTRRTPLARGARITPTRAELYATQNDNRQYSLQFFYRREDCREAVLVIGTTELVSNGYSSDDVSCAASFTLDRAQADRTASALGIQRRDRSEVGARLTGTFAPSAPRIRPGEAIEVVLTITNPPGAPPVRWRQGGRNRGPRDNQFSLIIERDGQPIAPIEAWDFGGLTGMPTLAPGESVTVRAPIAAWGDIARPGRYVVRCTYETELTVATGDPFANPTWDRRFEGVIRFEVR